MENIIKKGTNNVDINSTTYPNGSFYAKMEERPEGAFLYFYQGQTLICQGRIGDYTVDGVQVTTSNWDSIKDDLIKSAGGSGGSSSPPRYLHEIAGVLLAGISISCYFALHVISDDSEEYTMSSFGEYLRKKGHTSDSTGLPISGFVVNLGSYSSCALMYLIGGSKNPNVVSVAGTERKLNGFSNFEKWKDTVTKL